MPHKSHHSTHSSHHSSANRTLPKFADTSKLGEVEELEFIGVISKTHLKENDPIDRDPYNLNTAGSQMFTAISMEDVDPHRHSRSHSGHHGHRGHHDYPECTCDTGHYSSHGADNQNAALSYNRTDPNMTNTSFRLGSPPGTPATPPPDLGEIKEALHKGESQMSVYNPEEIFTSMAPRNNCLAIRQKLIAASYIRDLERLEAEELEKCNQAIISFHESRRHDSSTGGTSFSY